ncbi:ATP-binding protein [Schwartzia sp. (in: firmicutes)]
MRRAAAVFIFFLIMIISPMNASAVGESIRVGFVPTPGFSQYKISGKMSGYAIAWFTEITKYTNWQCEYVPFKSNEEMIAAVRDGKIDTAIGFGPHEPSSDHLFFTLLTEEPLALYTHINSDRFYYEDYANFNGSSIAVISNSDEEKTLRRYAEQTGFSYTPVPCTNHREVFNALDTNRADIALASLFFGTPDYRIVGYLGYDTSWTVVSLDRKDNFPTELSTYWLMAKRHTAPENFPPRPDLTINAYHSNTFSHPTLTREELRWIAEHPDFEIGYYERPPFMYTDSSTGEPAGIAIDIFNQLGQRLGMTFTFVKHSDESVLPAQYVNSPDTPDAILGMRYLPNRTDVEGMRLTRPYVSSAFGFVGHRDRSYSMTDWHSVAMPAYSKGTQQFLDKNYPGYSPIIFRTQDECLDAVRDGKADLALMDIYTINFMLLRHRYDDLMTIPATITPQEYCLGISDKVNPEFVSIINKGLLTIPIDVRQDIILSHTKDPYWTPELIDYFYKYRLAFVVIGILLILIVHMIFSDFFTRYRNMQILEEKNAELTDAIALVEFANQSKSRFLARMSHELRTPMNAILGFTNIALNHPENRDTVSDYLKKIRLSSQALLSIINDILDMSAIENNKLTIKDAPFKLSESVSTVHEMYIPQCNLKKITYEVVCDTQDNEFRGDQNRINQILLNLISNAVKFTPENGTIRVEFHEKNITENSADLVFVVQDNGIGMNDEFRSRLFKPFEQASAQTFQKYGGSGLGLSITKNLTELMHGRISLETKPGEGSKFTIEIPVVRIPQQVSAQAEEPAKYDFTGAHVLIAEDNALNLEIATMLLEDTGIKVTSATDGQVAIDKFLAAEEGTFDLILMDIQMPVKNGYEATKGIRASSHPQAKTIPIIAMTANAFEEDLRNSQEAGMNEHLAKPIDVVKLYKTLARFLPARS